MSYPSQFQYQTKYWALDEAEPHQIKLGNILVEPVKPKAKLCTITNVSKEELMPFQVKEVDNSIREKWLSRIERHRQGKMYFDSGKNTVTCKCPRCGSLHDSYILWTGRGTPRIFCPSCRQRVSSYCELTVECGTATPSKSCRRPGHMALE